jgi:hypothetical protein
VVCTCNEILFSHEKKRQRETSWRVLVMGIWGILVLLVPFWSISLQTEEETGTVLAKTSHFPSFKFCWFSSLLSFTEEKNGSIVSFIAGNFSEGLFYFIALILFCNLIFI